MLLVYSGAHDEVEVPDAGIVAQRGVPVEVQDDGEANRLLEQDTWARAKAPAADAKKDKS